MLIDGIEMVEGSDATNLTVASGTVFPMGGSSGELFFLTTDKILYIHDGTGWVPNYPGAGTVTSVGVDGGDTGLTFDGGPVLTAGVMTAAGTLAISSGGTGQRTASDALLALLPAQTGNAGRVLGTDGLVATWDLVSAAGLAGLIAEEQLADGPLLARVAADETVAGTWAFSNHITVPVTPTLAGQAASKSYVDTTAASSTAAAIATAVLKAGDTMTGPLVLPADGLTAGTQLVLAGGNVGIGTATAVDKLTIQSVGGNALGIYRDLDVVASGAVGVVINMGALVGAVPTVGAAVTGILADATSGVLVFSTRWSDILTERARFNANGNLGIGTQDPAVPIHIRSNGEMLRLETTQPTGGTFIAFNDSVGARKGFMGYGGGIGDDNLYVINTVPDFPVILGTVGSEKMRIAANGHIGIGSHTTVPSSVLSLGIPDVVGTIGPIGFDVGGVRRASIHAERHTASGQLTDLVFSTMEAAHLRINNVGRTLFGATTVPSYSLMNLRLDTPAGDVNGTPSIVITNKTTGINNSLMGGIFFNTFRDVADAHYTAGLWATRDGRSTNLSSASNIYLGTSETSEPGALPNPHFMVMYDGKVGVNLVPGTGGHVIRQNGTWAFIVQGSTNSTQLGLINMDLSADGSYVQAFALQSVVIGAVTKATSTSVNYATTSDYRLKNLTGPLDAVEARTFIDALKPQVGTWKADGSRFTGFVAHEFAEVLPTAVTGLKDGKDEEGADRFQLLDASTPEMMANIVALLQSALTRIDQLEARVAVLEAPQP